MKMNALRGHFLPAAVLLCTLQGIVACGSSSTSQQENTKSAQAIDGYIVGATVYCDDIEHGGTGAAGRLVCPSETQLIRIRGGSDVGFDEKATSGPTAFVGELSAPGTLDFVTPLSSVAVALSDESGMFESGRFNESVQLLAKSLGLSSLDLNSDASKTLQVIKLNAQIHQIISGFSSTADDYVAVTKEFAALVRSNVEAQTQLSLANNVPDTLSALNARLEINRADLALGEVQLNELSSEILSVNTEIEAATDIDRVALAAAIGVTPQSAVSINRDIAPVIFYSYWYGSQRYTLKQYELDTLFNGSYIAKLDTRYSHIYFGSYAFSVNKTLKNVKVGIGFEFEATMPGDTRKLSVTTTDALLSMTEGVPQSMQITFPENTIFHARSIDADGTISNATFQVEVGRIFSSINGSVGVSLDDLGDELRKRGHKDITHSSGNYKVTLVISGIKVNMTDSDKEFRASTYTVNSGKGMVSGPGFQGYVTVNDVY